MEKQILILALVSGEHLMGEVTESNGAYICADIVQIVTQDVGDGKAQMGFFPYMPYADHDRGIDIPTNLASIAFPSESLENHYKERFGKIITPQSKIIV